jgi:hypothetical protein
MSHEPNLSTLVSQHERVAMSLEPNPSTLVSQE